MVGPWCMREAERLSLQSIWGKQQREREGGRDRESGGGTHSDQNNEKRAKKKGEIEVRVKTRGCRKHRQR